MTPIYEELVEVVLEALANNKVRVDDLESLTKKLDAEDKYNAKQYTIDKKDILKKLASLGSDVESRIKAAIDSLPIPEDGKDGKDGVDGKEGKQGIEGKAGKPGKDGKDGPKGLAGKDGERGARGEQGPKGQQGKKGIDGKDGVGIDKITTKDSKIFIHLSNGSVAEFKLPNSASGAPAGVTAVPTEIVVLRNLSDTNIKSPVDDEVLTFSNGKWVNKPVIASTENVRLKVRATSAMSKGSPVSYAGWNAGLNSIDVELSDNQSNVSIGILSEDLAKNQLGYAITNGTLEGIDTSMYSEGTILYINGLGTLTDIEPSTGFSQPIAFVLRSQQINGALLITTDYPKQTAEDIRYDSTTTVKDAIDSLGSGVSIDSFKKRTEIESMFKEAQTTAYKELTYANGNITNVDIYVNSDKIIKLFSKIIGYNNGNITSITITDEVNGGTLDKTLVYSEGNLSSINTTYIH